MKNHEEMACVLHSRRPPRHGEQLGLGTRLELRLHGRADAIFRITKGKRERRALEREGLQRLTLSKRGRILWIVGAGAELDGVEVASVEARLGTADGQDNVKTKSGAKLQAAMEQGATC